jgi:tetratricopeptide (TPR) repeat protein
MRTKVKSGVVIVGLLVTLVFVGACREGQEVWEYHFKKGMRYTQKKDHDNAIVEFTNAIQAQPLVWPLYLARGKEYMNKEAYDKAIADYTKAIELNPSDDDYSFELRANAYRETGELRKAIDDYITALRISRVDGSALAVRPSQNRTCPIKAYGSSS